MSEGVSELTMGTSAEPDRAEQEKKAESIPEVDLEAMLAAAADKPTRAEHFEARRLQERTGGDCGGPREV